MTGLRVPDRRPLVVLNIVGLTPALLDARMPRLHALANEGALATLDGVFPAVTCTAQASMLTGTLPNQHGIVANGWYFRDLAEVWFWRQSNHLIEAEQVWDSLRKRHRDFACAQLFWWFNMYNRVAYSVTPRPAYPADGRKVFGLYSHPPELESMLQAKLGAFPFPSFWGPASGIASTRWIADCAREVFDRHRPALQFVYLPHLDYGLQRIGPDDPAIGADLVAVDKVAGDLIDHLRGNGAEVLVVSEYGIERAIGHVHINRILREHGYIAIRETLGWEMLDFGASRAFAVADHQVAHVYIREPADIPAVAARLRQTPGIDQVLGADEKKAWGIDHPRSGELIAVAEPGHWFTYYYWQDDHKAPDFAPTVDIHRKPGYDPVELFIDPELRFPKARIAWRLLQKKLGLRMLMDVIPLKPELVKGTHGRPARDPDHGPLLISSARRLQGDRYAMPQVKQLIMDHWD